MEDCIMNLRNISPSITQDKSKKKGYNRHFCDLAKRFFNQEKSLPILTYIYGDPPSDLNYPIKGSDMWNNVTKEKNYYMYDNEVKLINTYASEIKKYIPKNPIFIDLGPGSLKSVQEKTLPLLNTFENIKSYVPIDVSDTALKEAKELVKELHPSTRVNPIKADFYNYRSSFSYYDDLVAYCAGSTICNIPEKYDATTPVNTIKHLKKLRDVTGNTGTLVISHDANQDPESLFKAYDNEALHGAFLYLLHRMKWDLPIEGLDVDNFDCIIKWSPKNYRLSYYAKTKERAVIKLDGEKFNLSKGTELHIGNSYKYPVDVFKKIARSAGFVPVKHFIDNEKKMAIHVLKSKTTESANTA